MTKQEDTYFVNKVRKGDIESFKYLVERYKGMVYSIAYDILKNSQDAEDTAQEAFIRAFENISKFKEKSKFSTWLYRIVYNLSISQIRKKTVQTSEIKDDILSGNDIFELYKEFSESDQVERTKIINEALDKLNELDKTLIKLYYIEELSIKEISVVTELSISNVKVKLYRARQQLFGILNKNKEIIYE